MAIREYARGDEAFILPDEPEAKGEVFAERWYTIERDYPVAIVGLRDNGEHTFIHALVDKNAPAITGRDLKKIAHSIDGPVKTAVRMDYSKGHRLMQFAGFIPCGPLEVAGIQMEVYELCRGLQ